MPQSLANVLIHIVFSTKYREPVLIPSIRPDLHTYLATVARNLECECYRAGGVADHVHLAVRLSRMIRVADLVEVVKTSSSKWLKTRSPDLKDFRWQRGYGAFSVNPNGLNDLCDYIATQETHHRKHGFQKEYLEFLAKEGIEYDVRYVWD